MEIKCDYCGKVRSGNNQMFVIGASKEPDWVMIEGTGKMTCPACHPKAVEDGQRAIDRHCEAMGYRR